VSGRASLWAVIGIAPTTDTRAIRKAYTAKLKALNVEEQPAAFIELREAFEAALAHAERGAAGFEADAAPRLVLVRTSRLPTKSPTDSEPADVDAFPDPEPAQGPPPEPAPPRIAARKAGAPLVRPADQPKPEASPKIARRGVTRPIKPERSLQEQDDLFTLVRLLRGQGDIADVAPEICQITRRILASDAMQDIDQATDGEAFLADLIVETSPRSDVMAPIVINHFRWGADEVTSRASRAVQQVLQRQEDLAYLARISSPSHGLNRAYRVLNRPPPKRLGPITAALNPNVRTLLEEVRARRPTLRGQFNAEALAWWTELFEQPTLADRLWGPIARALPGGEGVWRAPAKRHVGMPVWLAVFVAPHIFVWILLRRGFSARARLAGFGWLAIVSVLFLVQLGQPSAPVGSRTALGQASPGSPSPVACDFLAADKGLPNRVVCAVAGGKTQTVAAPAGFGPATFNRAAASDAEAMVLVGTLYIQAPPPLHSRPQAAAWFRKAADAGNAGAMVMLGWVNGSEQGVAGDGRNLAEAVRWYRAAAQKGDAQGQYRLAALEEDGLATKKDMIDAVRLYSLSAAQGYAPAQARLGNLYALGESVPKDQGRALDLLNKAVAQDDPDGIVWLADLYRGKGDRPSATHAIDLYQRAIGKGVVDAWVNLGVLYIRGRGVPRDPVKAAQAFQHGVDAGLPTAMYDLSLLYSYGEGVKRSEARARELMRAAANKGFEPAAAALKSRR
jgi:TPR repeat protein